MCGMTDETRAAASVLLPISAIAHTSHTERISGRTPAGTRTQTEAILSRLPLPIGLRGRRRCGRSHRTGQLAAPAFTVAFSGFAPATGAFSPATLFGSIAGAAGRGRAANSSKT